MPNLEPIRQRYILDTTQMVRGLGRATRAQKKHNFAVKEMNSAYRLALRRAGAAAFAAIGASFFKASSAANKFNKQMAEVATLVDTSTVSISLMKKEILALFRSTPLPLADLTKGLYQTISASIPAASAIRFLGVAARAAVAGVTNVATAVNGMTSVVNAWAMSTDQANDVADTFFVTVRDGKTTFEELANNIGTVAPMAAGIGATFEEVSAAIAAMTLQGLGTDKAAVALRGFFNSLLRPTVEGAALAKQLGIEWNESSIRAGGLVAMMDDLRKKTGGNSRALAILVGNVRAANGVSALLKNGFDDLVRVMDDMATKADVMSTAFEKMQREGQTAWDLFKNNLSSTLIALGEKILPAVNYALESMVELMVEAGGSPADALIEKLKRAGIETDSLTAATLELNRVRAERTLSDLGVVPVGPVTGRVTRRDDVDTYGKPYPPDFDVIDVNPMDVVNVAAGIDNVDGIRDRLIQALDDALKMIRAKREAITEQLARLAHEGMVDGSSIDALNDITDAYEERETAIYDAKEALVELNAIEQALADIGKPAVGTPTPEEPEELIIVDPSTLKDARDVFKEYLRDVALMREKTDDQKEALQEYYDKQDALKELLEGMPALRLAEEQAVKDLALAEKELAETRAQSDVTPEAIEFAEKIVAIKKESLALLQSEITQGGQLIKVAEARVKNAEQRRRVITLTAAQLAEIKRLEDQIARAVRKVDKPLSQVLTTVEDIVRLFGDMGDEIQAAIRGLLQMQSAGEQIALNKAANLAKPGSVGFLASVIPQLQMAGAVYSIGNALLSLTKGVDNSEEIRQQHEERVASEKRLREALENVTREFRDIARALILQTTPGAALQPDKARETVRQGQEFIDQTEGDRRLREDLLAAGIGINTVEPIINRPEEFSLESQIDKDVLANLRRVHGADISAQDIWDVLNVPTPEEMIAAMESLGGEYANFGERVEEIIDETKVSLDAAVRRALAETVPTLEQILDAGLGSTGPSIGGVRERVSIGQEFLGEEGEESFNVLRDGFASLESLPRWVREAIGDLDFKDQKGLQAFIEDLFARRFAGTSQMSADEADAIAAAIAEFQTDEGEDEGISRSVMIQRTITEIQANELIAIQEQALLTLERIKDALTNSVGKGSTYNISVSVPPDVDNFGRVIMEQIENQIALKEAS